MYRVVFPGLFFFSFVSKRMVGAGVVLSEWPRVFVVRVTALLPSHELV